PGDGPYDSTVAPSRSSTVRAQSASVSTGRHSGAGMPRAKEIIAIASSLLTEEEDGVAFPALLVERAALGEHRAPEAERRLVAVDDLELPRARERVEHARGGRAAEPAAAERCGDEELGEPQLAVGTLVREVAGADPGEPGGRAVLADQERCALRPREEVVHVARLPAAVRVEPVVRRPLREVVQVERVQVAHRIAAVVVVDALDPHRRTVGLYADS